MLENLFNKTKYITVPVAKRVKEQLETAPDGENTVNCSHCSEKILADEYESNLFVCPKCGGYKRLSAYERLSQVTDLDSFDEINKDLVGEDPLNFPGYKEKLENLRASTGLNEAVVTGRANIDGHKCMIGVMDSSFMMASMGSAVGEKITQLFELATEEKLPVVLFTASGGARMHEGIISLMQMAKVSAAVMKHSNEGLLYITVLTDPTTGGVTASFAMLGDIILAEPNATIGFAGRRVIEGTIGHKLPKDFQTSAFQQKHGFVDMVIDRKDIKDTLAKIIKFHIGGEL